MAVTTTLAWKYLAVKADKLSPEEQKRLVTVAKGQVTGAQTKQLGELLFLSDLERVRSELGDFVLELTPWGMATLTNQLTKLRGAVPGAQARRA